MAEEIQFDKELKSALNDFGAEVVFGIVNVLRKSNKNASGKLINSINHELITLVQNINYAIEIYGEDYFQFVDEGRKKGKQPPINKIKQWCKLKGIDQNKAFPIARKIGRFGINPSNILQQALKEINTDKLINKIDDAFIKIIDQQIKQEYNKYPQ